MHIHDWIVPDWPAPKNVACISTTRLGGCSQGIYTSLNLAAHVGDDIEHVKQNRKVLSQQLQLACEPIWLEQQHGTRIIELTSTGPGNVQADAAFTKEPGNVCAVLTADCLPVLICDSRGSCVAIVHAGWRGLLNGVLENALNTLPIETKHLICWLGPAIGPRKFEVGVELQQKFVAKNERHEQAFRTAQDDKYFADICLLAKNILAINGIKTVFGGAHCTYTERERFFSYRRDGTTGRMATLIWLKS